MCKDQFNKFQPFVYDFRRPAVCKNEKRENYKIWRFPQNYHDIVKYGKIKTSAVFGEAKLNLLYGKIDKNGMQPSYTLVKIDEYTDNETFVYTLYVSDANIPAEELSSKSYFEPFGFTRAKFRKYMPVFEIKKTDDPNEPYRLSSALHESEHEKARNGSILYTAKYGRRNTTFYVIRDEFGKLELDKSCLSLPIVLSSNFVKLLVLLITFLPMKLGGCLLKQQNIIAKIFGNVFFTPFMPIKFSGNLAAAIVKIPILLFVGKKEKYGNCYYTLLKHEVKECWYDLVNGLSLIQHGKEIEKKVYKKKIFLATWEELNKFRKNIKLIVEQGEECQGVDDCEGAASLDVP